MKYIKLFEDSTNTNQEFWLFDYCILDGNDHSYALFPDKESVENYIIDIVNEEKDEIKKYKNVKFFTDVDEALDWYSNTFRDTTISYDNIRLKKPYKGSEELQKLRDVEKYNL